MAKQYIPQNERSIKKTSRDLTSLDTNESRKKEASQTGPSLVDIQRQIGNRALQRLLVQRHDQEPSELDDDTEKRINSARNHGQTLDSSVRGQMENAMGQDFSNVQVHTSNESNDINRQLGAKAFTTGNDVFFSDGSYQPTSSGGKELIAHELTHVVQQSSGAVGNSGKMTVNAPNDQFEQEADSVARSVLNANLVQSSQVQEDEPELIQKQEEDEDEIAI